MFKRTIHIVAFVLAHVFILCSLDNQFYRSTLKTVLGINALDKFNTGSNRPLAV